MTHVVPIAGLVMARFYVFENEALTALEMWKDGRRGYFSHNFMILFYFLWSVFVRIIRGDILCFYI